MDWLQKALIAHSDESVQAIDTSFGYLLNSMTCDVEQREFINRAISLGFSLVETAKRYDRKLAFSHNSTVWILSDDLTLKVFSKLDTQSLCRAAASCSFFRRCAMDPLCYANIDLVTVVPMIHDGTVATMVHRAGKHLQSLKLRLAIEPRRPVSSPTSIRNLTFLTRNCLSCLRDGVSGSLLKKLHLHHIIQLDGMSLCTALRACQNLLDLEILDLPIELKQILVMVCQNCKMLQRMFVECSKSARDGSLELYPCKMLMEECPHMQCLGLRGFKVPDNMARKLVKGFRELKIVDFSMSYSLTGSFLRNIDNKGGSLLEVLVLRDCLHLKKAEIDHFFSSILCGSFGLLRYLDISNVDGLAGDEWTSRCCPSWDMLPFREISIRIPQLCILAKFPSEESMQEFYDDGMVGNDLESDISSSVSMGDASDTSLSTILPDISSSSTSVDLGGAHPRFSDASSDEADYLPF